MRVMVHGVRRVDMTDDRGRNVRGYSLYCGYPADGVQGQEVTKLFVSDELANTCKFYPTAGVEAVIEFTPRGKISTIMVPNAK